MSQNEQSPNKSDNEENEINQAETDEKNEEEANNNNNENHNEEENEKEESAAPTMTRAHPKKPSPPKSHPSHSSHGSPTFESQMSPEQIETNLIKLFGNNFIEASKDNLILSDGLAVRDLRIIVRVLKLCTSSTQINGRKPILCDVLMKHMQKDHMVEAFKKYTEEKEKAKIARQKSREEKNKRAIEASKNQPQTEINKPPAKEIQPTSLPLPAIASTRFQTRHMAEKSNSTEKKPPQSSSKPPQPPVREKHPMPQMSLSHKSASSDNLSQHSEKEHPMPLPSINRNVKEVTIPRLKYDHSFKIDFALEVLKKYNELVLEVSDRLTEMERALSILTFKVAELEKII